MTDIMSVVRQFFVDDDWNFQELTERNALIMGFQSNDGSWQCLAEARDQADQFVFYSVLGSNVPAGRRAAIAEFITRANYGLPIGNFELDFSDGEVRYKTSIDVEGDRLTAALVKMLVYANVSTMARYYSGIMKVTYGGTDAADAIAEIEQ